jgi:hypothetical protein
LDQNQYPGIDERVVAIVRTRSNKLIGFYGVQVQDLPDLHQEWIAQIVRKPEYAETDHPDFERRIAHLVKLLAADELRRRKARKRNSGKLVLSLDYEAPGQDKSSTWGERITEEDYLDMTDWGESREVEDQVEIAQDAEAFMDQLGPDLRQIAEILKHHLP